MKKILRQIIEAGEKIDAKFIAFTPKKEKMIFKTKQDKIVKVSIKK